MSAWLERQASSHHLQLAAVAIASGCLVASTILGVQAIRRQVAIDELKASIPNADEDHESQKVSARICVWSAHAEQSSEGA
jgi:hypothetical protein